MKILTFVKPGLVDSALWSLEKLKLRRPHLWWREVAPATCGALSWCTLTSIQHKRWRFSSVFYMCLYDCEPFHRKKRTGKLFVYRILGGFKPVEDAVLGDSE